jgi:hypothetical protein
LGAFTYPRSEPGSAGHQDLVERLNGQIGVLREAAGVVADAGARPDAASWSAKEIVGHLCDVSTILHERLRRMILLEEPRLAGYDAAAMAQARDANAASMDALLGEFAAKRSATVDMLSELVHWNWARPGRHERLGRISIRQQVEKWLEHEDEHVTQLRALGPSGR